MIVGIVTFFCVAPVLKAIWKIIPAPCSSNGPFINHRFIVFVGAAFIFRGCDLSNNVCLRVWLQVCLCNSSSIRRYPSPLQSVLLKWLHTQERLPFYENNLPLKSVTCHSWLLPLLRGKRSQYFHQNESRSSCFEYECRSYTPHLQLLRIIRRRHSGIIIY